MKTVMLAAGREKSLARRHPWIFAGSIERVAGDPASGETVAVVDARGRFLARAAWSPQSRIRARVWSFAEGETIDTGFFARRVAAAVARRRSVRDTDAMRLVHGEADGLPGVVADRYAGVVVVQFTSAGAEAWRDIIVDALVTETGCGIVFERSDVDVREIEGLPPRTGPLRGDLPDVAILERGIRYRVDVAHGQKTGFYLDQRENRAAIRALSEGRRVLNCFCYTGGFSLAALAGGAESVVSVDSSAAALARAEENLRLNGLQPERATWFEADVFQELRRLRNAGESFDLVVLDPPKFAPTAGHAEKAARAYKDINLLALRLLTHDGLLATYSCSGGVSADLFQKIVAGAAADAPAESVILDRFQASPDHPVLLEFPEGEYLKGLLLQKR